MTHTLSRSFVTSTPTAPAEWGPATATALEERRAASERPLDDAIALHGPPDDN